MARQFITEALFLLNVVGLHPLHNNFQDKIRNVLALLLYLSYIAEISMAVVARWNGLETLEDASGLVGTYLILVKLIALRLHRKKLVCVLENIEYRYWKLDKFGPEHKNKVVQAYKVIRRTMITMTVSYLTTATGYMLKPIFSEMRVLPIDMYHFGDMNSKFGYVLAYAFEILVLLSTTLPCLFGFEYFLIALMFHVILELKLLKIGFTRLPIRDNLQGDDLRALNELNDLIEHHSMILRCIKCMRESFSIILLCQFLISLFVMGICLLSVSTSSFPPTLAQLMTPVPYLASYIFSLFTYCYGGNLLIVESESVADAAYHSLWWVNTQPELRGRIVLIIQRAQKVEKLTAGGMFDLDLANFTKVMRSTFSFFTLAQAVLSKSK